MVELLISGDLAQQVLALAQRNPKVARSLAQQFVARIEPVALQRFLLDDATAIDVLAKRLVQDPKRTIDGLQRLPVAKRARAVAVAVAAGKGPVAAPSPARPPARRTRRRQHLSAQQAAVLKQAIRQYLAAHPGANRRGILGAVEIPSDGLYNRLIGEMRAAGELAVSGARSSTTYSLKGRAGAPAARAKATDAAPGKGKGKAKGKAKAKAKRGAAATRGAAAGSKAGGGSKAAAPANNAG